MREFRYFSTFSGIGGFELGLVKAAKRTGTRLKCVGFSEVDKYAISVYEKHFKEHKNYGDIRTIKSEELSEFDCLFGGSPCQDFSSVGKRAGIGGEKSSLFFEFARIAREKRPRVIVLENVKGLLSSTKGRDFQRIISILGEIGYVLQWQVLDSQYFGSPQHRERVIIVGFLGEECWREIFPIGYSNKKTILDDGRIIAYGKRRTRSLRSNYINTITASYKGPSGDGNPAVIEGDRIRRLTPIECERCQCFPDDWTKYGKDGKEISTTRRYRLCGNSVCVNVLEEVFNQILKNEKEIEDE